MCNLTSLIETLSGHSKQQMISANWTPGLNSHSKEKKKKTKKKPHNVENEGLALKWLFLY